jgi:hypothetical protein
MMVSTEAWTTTVRLHDGVRIWERVQYPQLVGTGEPVMRGCVENAEANARDAAKTVFEKGRL